MPGLLFKEEGNYLKVGDYQMKAFIRPDSLPQVHLKSYQNKEAISIWKKKHKTAL